MKRIATAIGLVIAISAACTSNSGSPSAPTDDGGLPAPDGGATCQAPGASAACTTPEGGVADAGDASSPDAAAACTKHLPSGFSQVVAQADVVAVLTGASGSRAQAMLLDENDDPMVAYSQIDSALVESVHFVRWDSCAGAFTAPLTVDSFHTGSSPDVSIAYDPTTKEIGIAYGKSATDNDWADGFGEVWLATMKAPATSFSIEPLTTGSTDYESAGGPSIAMSGGHIYVAYTQGVYPSNDNDFADLAWLASSSTTPSEPPSTAPADLPDGGALGDAAPAYTEAGTEDAGFAPAHYFQYAAVPYALGSSSAATGFVCPTTGSASISVAVDSNGVPAVAVYQARANDVHDLVFWRANTAGASLVHTFTLDDAVDVSLTFEGTKPRIVGHMEATAPADASANTPDRLRFFASDDGITWGAGINLPNNDSSQNTAFSSAIAVDGKGNAMVASDINGGVGNGMACGANPYVATSSDEDDGGADWVACGVDTTNVHGYTVGSVSAQYGQSRIAGTQTLSFVSQGTSADAGADYAGIVYWQHP
jgi:hypothetical protein